MTEAMMEIRAVDGDFLANRISGLADGMAQYVRNRRPVGTRKEVMAAWRLSPEEARTIVEGRASKATVERVFHKTPGRLVRQPGRNRRRRWRAP